MGAVGLATGVAALMGLVVVVVVSLEQPWARRKELAGRPGDFMRSKFSSK